MDRLKLFMVARMLSFSFGCSSMAVSDSELNAFTESIIATSEEANVSLSEDEKIDCKKLAVYLELDIESDYCLRVAEDLGIPVEYVVEDKNYKELEKALGLHAQEAKRMKELQKGTDTGGSFMEGMLEAVTHWFTNFF